MNHPFQRNPIKPALAIWLAASIAAQAQITPFSTQPQAPPQSPQTSSPSQGVGPVVPVVGPGGPTSESIRPDYQLGPSDQILIHAPEADELDQKLFRIEDDGTATLPLIGVVKMGGSTVQQVEEDLKGRLKTFVKEPLITITVVQFRSSPVFFVGQFQRPGIYALQGRHTLVEMMMSVGGLQPTAGRRIKITRKKESGSIPLGSAVEDPSTKTSSVEISLVSLTQNINPAEDIELEPYDVISVDKAEQVFVQGALGKTGAFDVGERDYISILQLVSEAGGLQADAVPSKARILRPVLDTARRAEIPIDLTKIYATRGNDYPLLPNDILYVPSKKAQNPWVTRLITIAIGTGTSLLVFAAINGKL